MASERVIRSSPQMSHPALAGEGSRGRSSRSNKPRADTITRSGLHPKMTKQTFNQESEILEAKDQAEAAFSWAE